MYSLDFYNCNTIAVGVPAIYKQNGTENISCTRRYTLKYTNLVQFKSYTKAIPKLTTFVYRLKKAVYKACRLVYRLYNLYLYIVYSKLGMLIQLLNMQLNCLYYGIRFVSFLYSFCIVSNNTLHYTLYSFWVSHKNCTRFGTTKLASSE